MQKVLWILLLLVGFTGMSRAAVTVAADSTATETKEQTLYIFGVSQNLRDSVAYVTDIVAITAPQIVTKGLSSPTVICMPISSVVMWNRLFRLLIRQLLCSLTLRRQSLRRCAKKLRVKIAGQKVGLEKMVVKDVYKDQFQFKKIEVAGSN